MVNLIVSENYTLFNTFYEGRSILYSNYVKLRDSKGLTDYQVAKLAGIERSTLYEWGRGTYTPKLDKMSKIAKALDVTLIDLIGETT